MRSRLGRTTRGLHSRSHRSDNEPMDVLMDVLTAVQLPGAVFFHVRVGRSETGSWCDRTRRHLAPLSQRPAPPPK